MTRKELIEVQAQYEEEIREALAEGEDIKTLSLGFCTYLGSEMCYGHHERGQRLWAFFEAMSKVKREG